MVAAPAPARHWHSTGTGTGTSTGTTEAMTHAYIDKIGAHVGETVTIKGWLHNRRSSGKIHFLVVRDGTGFLQVVMGKKDVDEATFQKADHLSQESAIIITGRLRRKSAPPAATKWSPAVSTSSTKRTTIRSRRRSTAS